MLHQLGLIYLEGGGGREGGRGRRREGGRARERERERRREGGREGGRDNYTIHSEKYID